jgi:hypothetical protein
MLNIFNNNQLTMVFKVPISRLVALERIRQYFLQANYRELSNGSQLLQFQRFQSLDYSGKFLLTTLFLGNTHVNPIDRYSMATLAINDNKDSVNIKITFQESNNNSLYFFTEEILQNEMECFKKAIFDNVYEAVKVDHGLKNLYLSNLKYLLLQIVNVLILIASILVIFINLHDNFKVNEEVAIIVAIVITIALVAGLNKLFFMWRKKRIRKKVEAVK